MSGPVGAGERRVNGGGPSHGARAGVRRRSRERRRAQRLAGWLSATRCRSTARIRPLRRCRTTSSPGASPGSSSPTASKTHGSTGRCVQTTRPPAEAGRSSRSSASSGQQRADRLRGGVLLAEQVVGAQLAPGRRGVRLEGLDAPGARRADQPAHVVGREQRHEPLGLVPAGGQQRPLPVVAAPGLAGAGLAVPQDRPGSGSSARARAPRRGCRCRTRRSAGVAPCRSGTRRPRRSPRSARSRRRRRRPRRGRPSSAPAWCRPGSGSAGLRSGTPSRTRTPVSSSTSRTAAAVACSPRSSLPLGKDQSSYLGRCTSSTVPAGTQHHRPGRDDLARATGRRGHDQ